MESIFRTPKKVNDTKKWYAYYECNVCICFVSSIISCFFGTEAAKWWKAGLCKNATHKQCIACGVQNDIKLQRWCLPIFFPHSVTHSDFSVKDDVINFKFPLQPHQKYYITQYGELGFPPKKSFFGFEDLSHSEDEGKIKVKVETWTESISDWPEAMPMVSRIFCCCLVFTRTKMLLDVIKRSFSYQNGLKLMALSLLNLDTLGTGSHVGLQCFTSLQPTLLVCSHVY